MEKSKAIDASITVRELLEHYPRTRRVFVREGWLCFGCPTEAFHSLADVAREYQLDLDDLIRRLQDEARNKESL